MRSGKQKPGQRTDINATAPLPVREDTPVRNRRRAEEAEARADQLVSAAVKVTDAAPVK